MNSRKKKHSGSFYNDEKHSVLFSIVDKNFRYKYINNEVQKLFGITPASCIGRTRKELGIQPGSSYDVWLKSAFTSGEMSAFEYSIVIGNEEKIFQANAVCLTGEEQGPDSLAVLERDVTGQTQPAEVFEESSPLLDSIFNSSRMMLAYMDSSFNFIRVSFSYARSEHKTPSYYVGKNHFDLYPDEDNKTIFATVVKTGKPYKTRAKPFVYKKQPDKGVSYWDWNLIPIKDKHEKVVRLLLVLVDVTEYKKMEAELIRFSSQLENTVKVRNIELSKTSSELQKEKSRRNKIEKSRANLNIVLDQIFNITSVGIALIDLEHNYVEVNDRFCDMFNFNREDLKQMKCEQVWKEWICDSKECPIYAIQNGEEKVEYEISKTGHGSEITCYVSAVPFRSPDGTVIGVLENYIDITEKKKIQNEYVKAIVDERQRISHDLHDLVGQDLTAASYLMRAIKKEQDSPLVSEVSGLIKKAIEHTRDLSLLLNPVDAENTTLESSIKLMAGSMEKLYGVPCIVQSQGIISLKDHDTFTHIYYIAREAVNNALKHGDPGKVVISLTVSEQELLMNIEDNGTGIKEDNKSAGMGLKIMAYRASLLGARLSTSNISPRGFRVSLQLNL